MSKKEKLWENSLRDDESPRKIIKQTEEFYSKKQKIFNIDRSPMKNTESKDYNSFDFIRKIKKVSDESHIIADPFKPTLNKWIKDEDIKDCTIHHCKHKVDSDLEKRKKM